MKKAISALLALILCLITLSSCSGDGKGTLTVNGSTEVNSEIFSYFLDQAYYGEKDLSDSECIEIATSKCIEYLAVNTKFAEINEKLTQNEKADISLETNSLWRNYGSYYTALGISKDTFFKIKQYERCKNKLRFALYDKGGSQEINESYIKQYFTTNYVGIKYFYEDLFSVADSDKIASMSEDEKLTYNAEKATAENRYNEISGIANYVNSGVYTMDEAFMAVTGEVSADISVSATVVGRNDDSFSSEFIDAVFKQAVGSAFIITNNNHSYIYFIERVDLLSDDYDFYNKYRSDCLVAVSETFFTNEVSSWVQSYSAVRHMNIVNSCLKTVKNVNRKDFVGTDGYVFKSFNPET